MSGFHMHAALSRGFLYECYRRLFQSLHIFLCHSEHCSVMFLRVKTWFVHPLPFSNPACSILNNFSTAVEIHLIDDLAEDLAGGGQQGDASPDVPVDVVTFLGNFYNGTFAPIIGNFLVHPYFHE